MTRTSMYAAAGRRRSTWALAVLVLAIGPPAFGLTVDEKGGSSLPSDALVEVLCVEDCSPLSGEGVPDDFDFAFGARLARDGGHVELSSYGSLYVRGPVNATGDIHIEAERVELVGGTITSRPLGSGLEAGNIELIARGELSIETDRTLLIDPARLVPPTATEISILGSVLVAGAPIEVSGGSGGSISLRAGGGRTGGGSIVLDGGLVPASSSGVGAAGGVTASALGATDPAEATSPGGTDDPESSLVWRLTLDGDVYLDLSDYTLASLRLTAQRIVFVDDPTTPVPEPGTALLLGLGLAALATTRRA